MLMELLKAFFVGGIICSIGQLFIDYTKLTPARILTAYVIAGVILSALGIYQPLVDFAGAGASVPLTGFGHLLAKGVRDAIAEKGALGILSGGMSSAAGGITAALLAGLIASFCFKKRIKT